jgi:uncharacterized protein
MSDSFEIKMIELDEEACWRMLARAAVGRVGFADGNEVIVLPVNAAVHGRRVIFRTAEGSSLATRGDGAQVAFEADHTDRIAESGWSVLVRGRLWDVTDSAETKTWSEMAVHPWAPPPRDRWMAIEPHSVTGRSIERHRVLAAGRRVSYMPPD